MTLNELYDKMSIGTCVLGKFKVTIEYRGEKYNCTSTNTLAYDAAKEWMNDNDTKGMYYTPKQAFQALWDECKEENEL